MTKEPSWAQISEIYGEYFMYTITMHLVFINNIWVWIRIFFQDLKHFFQYASLASPNGLNLYHEFYNLRRGLHNDAIIYGNKDKIYRNKIHFYSMAILYLLQGLNQGWDDAPVHHDIYFDDNWIDTFTINATIHKQTFFYFPKISKPHILAIFSPRT